MTLTLLAATGASLLLVRGVELAEGEPASHWALDPLACLWLLTARAQLIPAAGDGAARPARVVTGGATLAVGLAFVL